MTNFNLTCHSDGRPCSCTEGKTTHGCAARDLPRMYTLYPVAPSPAPSANPKARHGAAKPNLALIPAGAQLQIAPVFALGAEKYGRYNWRKDAVEAETYVAAAQRHLFSWFDGEDVDPESGQLHLAHAAACLMILLDASSCGKLIDNRPHPGAAAELIRTMTKPVD